MSPATRRIDVFPVATLALVIANVGVFLLPAALGAGRISTLFPALEDLMRLERLGALFPFDASWKEPWRFFACTTLHAGILHLLSNMISLLAIGTRLEQIAGSRRFLVIYGGAAAAGALASALYLERGMSVGASGAVFGVGWGLLATLIRCAPVVGGVALASASFLLFLLLLALVGLPWLLGDLFVVDHAAHVGGSVAGFVLGIVPRRLRWVNRGPVAWFVALFLIASVAVPLTRALIWIPNPITERFGVTEDDAYRWDTLETFGLRIRVPISWTREEDKKGVPCWTLAGQEIISIRHDRRMRGTTEDLADEYEKAWSREVERGTVDDYDIVLREDLIGVGPGGILMVIHFHVNLWQEQAQVLRFLETPKGEVTFTVQSDAGDESVQRAINILRGIEIAW